MKIVDLDAKIIQRGTKWPELIAKIKSLPDKKAIEVSMSEITERGFKTVGSFTMYIRTTRTLDKKFSTCKKGDVFYIFKSQSKKEEG